MPASPFHLHVGPMDAVLVEWAADGRVRFEGEEWTVPTLQERRATLYAAQLQLEVLAELVETLEGGQQAG